MDRRTGFYWLFARLHTFKNIPFWCARLHQQTNLCCPWLQITEGSPHLIEGVTRVRPLKYFSSEVPVVSQGPHCLRQEGGFPQEIFTLHLQVKKTYVVIKVLLAPACTHSCETSQQLDGSEWEVACSVCVCVCVHICWQLCLNGANLYDCVSRELQGFWHLFLIITIKRMTSDAVTTVQVTKRSWFKKLVPSKPWMVSLDGNFPRQVSGKDSEWWRRKCTEDKRI